MASKKLLLSTVFVASMSVCLQASAEGWGDYSDGYRMGQLVKFSETGLFFRSGEGELLMGNESTPVFKTYTYPCGKSTCEGKKQINPWRFSVDLKDKEVVDKLKASSGEYVVLKYKQSIMHNPLADSTSYVITDVVPVKKPTKPVEDYCKVDHAATGARADGFRSGRIVKVATTGAMLKSWEIQMQVGNSGSGFVSLSVSDPTLAKCLTEDYLKTGQQVQLTYNESYVHNPLSQATNLEVVKVEPFKRKSLNDDEGPAKVENKPEEKAEVKPEQPIAPATLTK